MKLFAIIEDKSRNFTDKEIDGMYGLYKSGKSYEEISKIYKSTPNIIRRSLIFKYPQLAINKEDIKTLYDLVKEGYTYREVGKLVDLNSVEVKNLIDSLIESEGLEQINYKKENEPDYHENYVMFPKGQIFQADAGNLKYRSMLDSISDPFNYEYYEDQNSKKQANYKTMLLAKDMMAEGIPLEDISRILNVSDEFLKLVDKFVHTKPKNKQITRRRNKKDARFKYTDEDISQMREMYDSGMSFREIGNKLGMRNQLVRLLLINRSEGFKPRPRKKFKYTDEDVSQMREMYDSGASFLAISKRYNTHSATIRNILLNKSEGFKPRLKSGKRPKSD